MEELIGGDRVRRAGARREREFDEQIGAEDAEALVTGPPRSRTTSDVVEDGPTHQSETRGVDERQSSATIRPAE